METVADFLFLGSKITADGDCSHEIIKNPPAMGRAGFDPWVGNIPCRRERFPTSVFWPGEFYRPCSPWSCKESDTTEQLSLSLIKPYLKTDINLESNIHLVLQPDCIR